MRKRSLGAERMTLAEAFELHGDSDDRERVVRAVALLLDWTPDSRLPDDQLQTLSRGLGNVLYDVANGIAAMEKRRQAREEEESSKMG